jgi:hypothetical protein
MKPESSANTNWGADITGLPLDIPVTYQVTVVGVDGQTAASGPRTVSHPSCPVIP